MERFKVCISSLAIIWASLGCNRPLPRGAKAEFLKNHHAFLSPVPQSMIQTDVPYKIQKATNETLDKDACEQAINPLLRDLEKGRQSLALANSDSLSTLYAATGGALASITSLIAAAMNERKQGSQTGSGGSSPQVLGGANANALPSPITTNPSTELTINPVADHLIYGSQEPIDETIDHLNNRDQIIAQPFDNLSDGSTAARTPPHVLDPVLDPSEPQTDQLMAQPMSIVQSNHEGATSEHSEVASASGQSTLEFEPSSVAADFGTNAKMKSGETRHPASFFLASQGEHGRTLELSPRFGPSLFRLVRSSYEQFALGRN